MMKIISPQDRVLQINAFKKSWVILWLSFQKEISTHLKIQSIDYCILRLKLRIVQHTVSKNICCILVLLILGMHAINAQQEAEKNPYKLDIPLLPVLIDSALANNKMLEFRKLEIDAKTHHAKSKAKNWTRYMGFQGGAQYGVFDNFSTSDQVNITSNDVNSSLLQWNFNVGVFLKIPIFGIVSNKDRNNIAAVEIEQARNLHGSLIEEITDDVIRLYEDLILRQELLEINAKNYANGRVNFEMIQKEFENGHISVTEYVRISDVITKLTIEYEKSKSYFFQAKKLLENKVGFKIN